MQAKLGRKMNIRSQAALVKAMCAATRCTSLGCMGRVTRSTFLLLDWELAKVALSCHTALNMLCQELNGFGSWSAAARTPFLSLVDRTVTKTERVVVRE